MTATLCDRQYLSMPFSLNVFLWTPKHAISIHDSPIFMKSCIGMHSIHGQFRGDGRTVRTLVFGVYKIYCITGSYLWVIQKDITL